MSVSVCAYIGISAEASASPPRCLVCRGQQGGREAGGGRAAARGREGAGGGGGGGAGLGGGLGGGRSVLHSF